MSRGSSTYFSEGVLDEVAVWDRVLSDIEVLSVYRRGANRLEYQVRTCVDPTCLNENWTGSDGTKFTYFSELHNIKTAGTYDANGSVQTDPLSLYFPEFSALTNKRYFQYRVIMESDDEANSCSGSTCMPSIDSVTVGPQH
jgi:hypothetical protein